MGNYLVHDLTVDEMNRVLRLVQSDISHAKKGASAAPTQTVLGTSSVASLLSTPGSGTGTVTSVTVATANGFQGSVATPTTTPVITITTSLTQGSIVFVGSSGGLTQDNANFFYNPIGYGGNSNMEIGPRGTNPLDASYEFYVASGVTAHFHNINPTQSITGGVTIGLMYIPTGSAVTSGNRVGSLEFGGSIDVSDDVGTGAAIRCYPTQNYSVTTLGTKMVFQTVPNGSATLATALTLNQDQSAVFTNVVTAISFNAITGLYASIPAMDSGSGAIGSSTFASPGNHIHPTDTSRAASNATTTLGSTTLTLGGTSTSVAGLTLTGSSLNGTLGATTPSSVAATTISASGIITSTIATGTAPFTIASTTPVANLSIGGNAATATQVGTTGTPNSFYYSGASGVIIFGKTGGSFDLQIVNNAGQGTIQIPAGTQNVNMLGNVDLTTIGAGLRIAEGTNAKQGVATLALGTVTVANTSVTAVSRVFLSRQGLNASTTLGELAVNSIIAGTSFTITAYIPTTALVSTGDLSTIAYEIIEPG